MVRTQNVSKRSSVASKGSLISADAVHQRLILNSRELSDIALAEITPQTMKAMERKLSEINTDLAELHSFVRKT